MDVYLPIIFAFIVGIFVGRASKQSNSPTMSQLLTITSKFSGNLPEDVENRVKEFLRSGQKIEALKHIREATGLGLKASKELVDDIGAGRSCDIAVLVSSSKQPKN